MDMVVVTNGGDYTNYLLLEQKNFVIVKKISLFQYTPLRWLTFYIPFKVTGVIMKCVIRFIGEWFPSQMFVITNE